MQFSILFMIYSHYYKFSPYFLGVLKDIAFVVCVCVYIYCNCGKFVLDFVLDYSWIDWTIAKDFGP